MPDKPYDHEKCRGRVCLLCLRKSDRQVNSDEIEKIRKSSNLFKSIHPIDQRVPNGICKVCKKDLKNPNAALKIPKDFCFSKEVVITPKTRSNSGDTACSCLICRIGKLL